MLRQLLTQSSKARITTLLPSKTFFLSSSTQEGQKVVTEMDLREKLTSSFPKATAIEIEDISGGCGSMFQVYVESFEFAGMPKVKQHQLINKILKEEIGSMHGIRINTGVPK